MRTELGGPGVACSITRIRRLEAGELAGDERSRTEAHLAGCARCQASARELAREREALHASLPFERFAAGVAEGLARADAPVVAPRLRLLRAGLALAAVVVALAAVPLLLRIVPGPDAQGWRAKGAIELTLWASEAGSVRALAAGEPVPPGASLRVGLPATGHAHAAVALVDRDGVAVLYAGPATAGAVGDAFAWTGAGDGALVAVLDDRPVDVGALRARLAQRGANGAAGAGAEVIVRPLARGRR
ncbi:zf-HC2 domain-containing protein [Anaeromyxobacter terrae]|uniref:zf-HC2 domain-containing protein n=1 Tax=Anaeromyxobacter terrae TaxID=2925406 RepID=UPI001F596263|nr:zf-HC2 domain-containing protein [Anaeromyxobacter sp. SG22]